MRGVDEPGLAGRPHDVHRLAVIARLEEERADSACPHLRHHGLRVGPGGGVEDVHPRPQAAVGGEAVSGHARRPGRGGEEQVDRDRGEGQPGQALELLPGPLPQVALQQCPEP